VNQKVHLACNFKCIIESKDFLNVTDSYVYCKYGNISEIMQDRCVATDHKYEVTCDLSVVAIQMIMSHVHGGAAIARLFQCDFSYVGSRAFNVSGPQVWNELPKEVVSATTFSSFRRRLKPFLFQQ